MATSQEVFEQIQELFVSFEENHNGTTKAAKSRARKHIGEIKKLVTDYRKLSVDTLKSNQDFSNKLLISFLLVYKSILMVSVFPKLLQIEQKFGVWGVIFLKLLSKINFIRCEKRIVKIYRREARWAPRIYFESMGGTNAPPFI